MVLEEKVEMWVFVRKHLLHFEVDFEIEEVKVESYQLLEDMVVKHFEIEFEEGFEEDMRNEDDQEKKKKVMKNEEDDGFM
ncbi:hypothetical protein Tco_1139477 [Tanacetum coccineum]